MNAHDKWLQAPYEAAEEQEAHRQAAIAAEADALLAEWKNFGQAMADVDGYELLLEERTSIVNAVAFFLGEQNGTPEVLDAVKTCIADRIIDLVKDAALKVAAHRYEVAA
jgi:hypothetical protein